MSSCCPFCHILKTTFPEALMSCSSESLCGDAPEIQGPHLCARILAQGTARSCFISFILILLLFDTHILYEAECQLEVASQSDVDRR